MDTAFKRRFEWEYVSPNPVCESAPGVTPIVYKNNVQLALIFPVPNREFYTQ